MIRSKPSRLAALALAACLAGGAAAASDGRRLEAPRDAGSAPGPQIGEEAQACLDGLRAVLEPEEAQIPFLPQDRTLSTLSQAATIFAQSGQADRCDAVVQGIERYVDIRRQRLEARSEQQAVSMADRLRQARPVGTDGPWRASDLMGSDLLGRDGQYLGEVDDVVVSPDGTTRFVLVGRGGFLGIDEDLIPIRVSQLRVVDDRTLLVPIDGDRLAEAPRYREEDIRQPGIVARWSEEASLWWTENLPAE